MERTIQKHGAANFLVLLAAGVGTFAVARYCNSLAGQVLVVFIGLGVLVSLMSWFQMRLEERERLERLEFDEVTKGGAASSTLFNTGEAEAFPARRSREQFEKFFLPGFTILLMLLEGAAFWWLWQWLGRMPALPAIVRPLVAMSIPAILGLVLFMLGQFSSGLARQEGHRLLRPGANALLLAAYLLWLMAVGIVGVWAGLPPVDFILARAFCVLLAMLAAENLLILLFEVYRPRVRGRIAHILYDSRLVGLISHPEGIFTTVAHTLDYQFGFKVSETWFYQFLRRSIAWLGLAYFVILAGSTCLVHVGPGEQALLERFGQPVAGREILVAGFHLKLPWPIDRAHGYRTHEIQQFEIGAEHEEETGGAHHDEAVLWTVSHYKAEFNLLVASRETDAATTNATGKKAPPVNLLSVGIPVQYQINNLTNWAYNYSDAGTLLKQLATREVVRYLVGVDVNDIMSTARFTAGDQLRQRIQARADELKLGATILFVGLQDVHPPVAVGAAYEKVVGSKQKRDADRLRAEADATRTNALAQSEALRRRLDASAQSVGKVAGALATESLFTNQIAAFRASPEVYTQRSFLQTVARHGAGARKFVLATTNSQEILLLNMEDKIRDDILNIALPAPKPK